MRVDLALPITLRLAVSLTVVACGGNPAVPDAAAGDAGSPDAFVCEKIVCGLDPADPANCVDSCDSPVVPGGAFYRDYDLAGDGMHELMVFPATVSTFRLDKYEVTVGRFRAFVGAGFGTQANPPVVGAGARRLNGMESQGGWDPDWNLNLALDTPALIADVSCDDTLQTWADAPGDNEDRPMNCIDWYEAMAFCIWDGGFLPTATELNYAASGGSEQRAFPWSSPAGFLGIDNTRASYYVDGTKQCFGDGVNGCALTDLVVVGSKSAGDGRWGHSDLAGNVWEWALDVYPSVTEDPCDDCANLTPGSNKVLHGGSYGSLPFEARSAYRGNTDTDIHAATFGMRCARAQ